MIERQRGDTIVEVLIAMAVVGITLGAAFGIANRSTNIGRQAQERTEALKIAESQLETLILKKQDLPDPAADPDLVFCFDESDPDKRLVKNTDSDYTDLCTYQDGDGEDGLYSIVISYDDTTEAYKVNMEWERLGASTSDNEESLNLYYRVQEFSFGGFSLPGICGASGGFNFGQYVANNPSIPRANFDVLYYPGQPPHKPESSTDFRVSAVDNIRVDANCNYEFSFQQFCGTPSGDVTDSTGSYCPYDQPYEAVYAVMFAEDNGGSDAGYRCSGLGTDILAFFRTEDFVPYTPSDSSNPVDNTPTSNPKEWGGSNLSDVEIIRSGQVKCIHVVHVCDGPDYATRVGLPTGFSMPRPTTIPGVQCGVWPYVSSVHLDEMTWTVN